MSRGRKEVAFLLLAVALPSFLAHASNERTFHIICLVYLAAAAWLSVRQRFVELPFAAGQREGLGHLRSVNLQPYLHR